MAEKLQYQLTISTRARGTGARDTREELRRLSNEVSQLGEKVRVQEFATYDLDKALAKTSTSSRKATQSQAALDAQRALGMQTIRQLTAAEKQAEVQTGRLAGKKRDLNLAALSASQGFEDLQYGLRATLNNIPMLVMQLGGSAGLAAAISATAVTLSIFAKRVDAAKEKLKESGEAAEESNQQVVDFLESIRQADMEGFIAELDAMETAHRLANDAQADALELEVERRQSLDRISEKLREAAELEIQLAEVRGDLSAEDAAAARIALRGEAEAAQQQAQLALAQDRVNAAELEYQQQVDAISRLEERRAELEKKLAERQAQQDRAAESIGVARRNLERDPDDANQQRDLESAEQMFRQLRDEVQGIYRQIDRLPVQRDRMMEELAALGQEIDQAIGSRDIIAEELSAVSEIAVGGAKTAATIAAEEARAAVEERMEEATAAGQQASEDIRTAFATLNDILADGIVDNAEAARMAGIIERFTSGRAEVDQRLMQSFQKLGEATSGLLQKVSAQERRVSILETNVRALNNGVR